MPRDSSQNTLTASEFIQAVPDATGEYTHHSPAAQKGGTSCFNEFMIRIRISLCEHKMCGTQITGKYDKIPPLLVEKMQQIQEIC